MIAVELRNYGDTIVFTYLNPPAINDPYRSRPRIIGQRRSRHRNPNKSRRQAFIPPCAPVRRP